MKALARVAACCAAIASPCPSSAALADAIRAFPGLEIGARTPFSDHQIAHLPRCAELTTSEYSTAFCFIWKGVNYRYRLDDRTLSEKLVNIRSGAWPYGLGSHPTKSDVNRVLNTAFHTRMSETEVDREPDGNVKMIINRTIISNSGCIGPCTLVAIYDPDGHLLELSIDEYDSSVE